MQRPAPGDDQIPTDNDVLELPDHHVAALAYHLWMERGCPIGSPDDDWFRAEVELKNHLKVQAAAV